MTLLFLKLFKWYLLASAKFQEYPVGQPKDNLYPFHLPESNHA